MIKARILLRTRSSITEFIKRVHRKDGGGSELKKHPYGHRPGNWPGSGGADHCKSTVSHRSAPPLQDAASLLGPRRPASIFAFFPWSPTDTDPLFYGPSSVILNPRFSLTVFINRRDRRTFLQSSKNADERLRSLDAVSPTRTLEEWWTITKGSLGLSEAVDGHFVW